MKVKHIIIIFLLGLILMTIGALFKLQHWPGGGILMSIATVLKVIAGILTIWKVLTSEKFKGFLNS